VRLYFLLLYFLSLDVNCILKFVWNMFRFYA
jgi:hypothetical protein